MLYLFDDKKLMEPHLAHPGTRNPRSAPFDASSAGSFFLSCRAIQMVKITTGFTYSMSPRRHRPFPLRKDRKEPFF